MVSELGTRRMGTYTTYLMIRTRKNTGKHVKGVLRNNLTLAVDKGVEE